MTRTQIDHGARTPPVTLGGDAPSRRARRSALARIRRFEAEHGGLGARALLRAASLLG